MGREKTRVSDSEGVRRENVKEREKNWENLPWEREGTKKYLLEIQRMRERLFSKKKI